jgi:hypothetical protein
MPDVARTLDLPSGQRFEAHTARRTARLVKAAPAGCYKIGLQLRGSSVLIQDGREATLTPGDFTLYDSDRPYTLAFSDPHRMRQLHKHFHASGTTVAGWIMQRRLERCGHDLRDPRWSGRPVASIGARWGYPDPAHFSRLFKAAYGIGPRDYRGRCVPSRSSGVRWGARRAAPRDVSMAA